MVGCVREVKAVVAVSVLMHVVCVVADAVVEVVDILQQCAGDRW